MRNKWSQNTHELHSLSVYQLISFRPGNLRFRWPQPLEKSINQSWIYIVHNHKASKMSGLPRFLFLEKPGFKPYCLNLKVA